MLTYDRHIAHLDMDSFYVSVERLRNSKLNNKPILIGGSNDRGIVAACSAEAKRFGIYATMPMRIALRLCKHATVLMADYEAYSQQSKLITDILRSEVPVFEKASLDEFYVDLSGMDKFFGCKTFTDGLKQKIIRESGLPSSYGLASNKLVSKVAARQYKPNAQMEIPFGNEKSFLAPLSITKIPGVGKETAFRLIKMGVETIKVLSDIPVEMLVNLLGKPGTELWRRANGIDESPVVPFKEQKSISTEQLFQQDTIDMLVIHSTLVRMTETSAYALRQQNKLTGCVVLKIRYSDMETHTMQSTIPYSNADHVLIATVRELFTKLFTRRVLIRLLGIGFTNLVTGTYQIDLFEDKQETIQLYKSIDSIKGRFGEGLLKRASSVRAV